jgi:RNA polymerase sigma-70 factor (ECF subfamily)
MARASVLAVDGRPRRVSEIPHARLERLFAERHSLVWRTLRRLGLSPAEAADTTRRVFQEAAKRFGSVLRSQERTKLLTLALRYAFTVDRFAVSEVRSRPPVTPRTRSGVFARSRAPASAACVDFMDRVLSHMPRAAATVFILFELEGLPLAEVAEILSLNSEAAQKALLHARAEFKSIVAALAVSSGARAPQPAPGSEARAPQPAPGSKARAPQPAPGSKARAPLPAK